MRIYIHKFLIIRDIFVVEPVVRYGDRVAG